MSVTWLPSAMKNRDFLRSMMGYVDYIQVKWVQVHKRLIIFL